MKVGISGTNLSGDIKAIPSKSDLHRSLICAALADGESLLSFGCDDTLENGSDLSVLLSDDIYATINCLKALGADISIDGMTIKISSIARAEKKERIHLDCGESGSTLRFILPVAAALGQEFTITGHGRLPDRPIKPLLTQMRAHGCIIDDDKLPLSVRGKLTSGKYEIPGDISSQFISGLLMALPILDGNSKLTVTNQLESHDYINMTINTLMKYTNGVSGFNNTFKIPGNQKFTSMIDNIENDWSNSAFWLCAGALSPKGITVKRLDTHTVQPDEVIIDLLSRIGADIKFIYSDADSKRRITCGSHLSIGAKDNNRDIYIRKGELKGTEFDASQAPDLVPIMAVLLSVCEGSSRIHNAARLRLKESDRLKAIANNLSIIGADIKETEDSLIIHGVKSLSGGIVSGYGDHRIVMSMAISSVLCENDLIIEGADAVNKSYKSFFEDFKKLGGNFHVI